MARAQDNLKRYREKRDFTRTPEPAGQIDKSEHYRYLIQKHAASHLHYDFRLELDGTLKSWAIPKGPSLNPQDKRLAIQVEDHPISYGSFEGVIPKGQYGGGTVMLWDEGTWEPVGDPRQGLAGGKLVFRLHGKRLKGEWTLVKSFRKEARGNNWLLIKHADEEVRSDNDHFLQANNTSVTSGRTMEDIAAPGARIWQSHKQNDKQPNRFPARRPSGKKTMPKLAPLPGFIPPQLATLSTGMPKGTDWLHEIKFDGYRMISHVESGSVHIFSRNGKDWTRAFQPVADALASLPVGNAILDGEIIAIDAEGKSDFSALKDALSLGRMEQIQYYLFDLLYHDGENLMALPLLERKSRLQALLTGFSSPRIFYSEHFQDVPQAFLHNICKMRLEGVISKKANAPYRPGRNKLWLKTKCQKRQEFVIGGFTLPSTGALGIGSLLLGYYDESELEYAGRVGTGFTNASSMQLRKKLDSLRQKEKPYIAISTEGRRGAIWVKPKLVCEVEFTEWTADGHLRHPSFKGLREDKPAMDIRREIAVTPPAPSVPAPAPVKGKETAMVGGIRISHPSRVIYPQSHITKQALAEYYYAIADAILPHIADRPISMVRCPEGASEPCFFQRHVGMGKTPHLHEVEVTVNGTSRDYLMIRDVKGLISLVQWGVIELHPWQCKANKLDKPDRMIFDLDPGPEVTWAQLIEGAQEVRGRMEELGLESFIKTTGGKGLHVVIPLTPAYGFPAIKSFARAIAESMAQDNPRSYIAKMSKAARTGRIFVDYLRNDVTSTAVAAFSARARPGATVSMPLSWDELVVSLDPAAFTVQTVPARLATQPDVWEDFFKIRQKIARKHLQTLHIAPE
jgi:bifunctional non-homologous end joining protein LigD